MTQSTKATWISGVFFSTPLVVFIVCEVFGSKVINVGNYHVPFGFLCFVTTLFILKLIPIIAWIAFVVQGFRVYWGWGLANLLVPLAFIGFCCIHPRAAKVPLIITVIGVGWLLALILFLLFVTKA
jgi:hypothetical protein